MKLTIRKPDDFHLHLRDGEMLKNIAPFSRQQFARALIMPNLAEPILTAQDVERYRDQIVSAGGPKPLMTIKLTRCADEESLTQAFQAGAIAAKLYPEGVTTNSDSGIYNLFQIEPQLSIMQNIGMVLSIHAEVPKSFCLDREADFLDQIGDIAKKFPKLKMVIEHITTEKAVEHILGWNLDNVAATITVHHLELTLDDIIGDKLRPHHFCKPIAKRPQDKEALIEAAISGNPKFFFGSDSAPHQVSKKECDHGCAGVFSAPVAMPLLTEIFESYDNLDKLENFTSRFGAEFYGLELNNEVLELGVDPWTLDGQKIKSASGVQSYGEGRLLKWKVMQ